MQKRGIYHTVVFLSSYPFIGEAVCRRVYNRFKRGKFFRVSKNALAEKLPVHRAFGILQVCAEHRKNFFLLRFKRLISEFINIKNRQSPRFKHRSDMVFSRAIFPRKSDYHTYLIGINVAFGIIFRYNISNI